MERYLAPDEARQQILDAFPPRVGELFYEISTSVAHLHLNWRNYRSLFGTSPECIELLNWAASSFFGLLDGILLHNIVLAIARLMDTPRYRNYDHASLARLIEALESVVDKAMVDSLKEKLRHLAEYYRPMREIRNRVVAHEDLATALSYHPDPLPGLSRAYVEEILEGIRSFLNEVEEHFLGSPNAYQHVYSLSGGESLMRVLESAREHEACCERKFRQKYGIEPDGG